MILRPASGGRYTVFQAILPVILVVLPRLLLAQPDNLTLLQQNALSAGDSLMTAFSRNDTVCLSVVPHPAAWLVEQGMLHAAENRGITVVPCIDTVTNGISIAVTSIGIEYLAIDEPDSLQRIAYLALSTAYDASRTQVMRQRQRLTRSFSCRQADTVDADETSSLEASGYDFARGTLPPRTSSGFWSKIVEPAVILGASVVMVILLFTVRSQ